MHEEQSDDRLGVWMRGGLLQCQGAERCMVVYWRRDREDSITARLSLHAQHHPLGPVSGKCGRFCVHAAAAQWLHVSIGLPDTQQRIRKLSMQVLPEYMWLYGTSRRLRLPSQPFNQHAPAPGDVPAMQPPASTHPDDAQQLLSGYPLRVPVVQLGEHAK